MKGRVIMALGFLEILYGGLLILAIILQVFLYKDKNKSRFTIYLLNGSFGLILSYLGFSSQPSNFEIKRIQALIIGGLAILGLGYSFFTKKDSLRGKVLLSLSIIAGFMYLFL